MLGGPALSGHGVSGITHKQNGVVGAIPESVFAEATFFTEMPTVIAPEDDDGVVAGGIGFDGIHDSTHATIGKCVGGKVGLQGGTPGIDGARGAWAIHRSAIGDNGVEIITEKFLRYGRGKILRVVIHQ